MRNDCFWQGSGQKYYILLIIDIKQMTFPSNTCLRFHKIILLKFQKFIKDVCTSKSRWITKNFRIKIFFASYIKDPKLTRKLVSNCNNRMKLDNSRYCYIIFVLEKMYVD
jgi:hypothetical protein